jgi:hypothetical protein
MISDPEPPSRRSQPVTNLVHSLAPQAGWKPFALEPAGPIDTVSTSFFRALPLAIALSVVLWLVLAAAGFGIFSLLA